jgi:epothilone synthetase B
VSTAAVARPAALPAAPGERHLPFPLTEIQQAYWLGRRSGFELGGVAIHGYAEVEADGVDLPALEAAWNAVVARHDMLRAVVSPAGTQRVLEAVPRYRIEVLDLRGDAPAAVEASLAEVRARMSHQCFDLERWPLFEIRASLLPGGGCRLHVSIDGLCVDLSSLTRVLREWMDRYRDPEAPHPPLPFTYRDYVLAAERLRHTAAYRASADAWRASIADLPPAPELPRARGTAPPRFARRAFTLEAEAWAALKRRAAEAGLTPASALLAAYAEVVRAWSASPRYTLNVTLENRLPLHPAVDDVVGDFTSLVLVGVDGESAGGFAGRALRLQRALWSAMEHRRVSGVQVLREMARLEGRPGAARMPVVHTGALGSPGFHVLDALGPLVHCATQTPQVLLDQQVHEHRGRLLVSWDAVEGAFVPGVLDDMFSAGCVLLQELAAGEGAWRRTGAAVPLLPEQRERRARANATEAAVPRVTLHDLFAARAEARGAAPAVFADGRVLSYAALARRTATLAHELRRRGTRPGTPVALVMEKGWEQAVGVLATLAAGGAVLPLDPEVPPERLTALLANSGATLALTQSWLEPHRGWPHGVNRIVVDGGEEGEARALPDSVAPEDLAYVLYTSGSTGTPRGAMVEHRAVVNRIADVNHRFGVGPEDRVFSLTPLHHDLAAYDLFGLLAAGGAVVLPAPAGVRDPAHWVERMAAGRVTVWNSVPAAMEMLVTHLERAGGAPAPVRRALRLVLLSGDWIPLSLPARVRALFPHARVVALGGPTETTIWDICFPVETVDPAWASIPYGRPMANARYHVLDEALEPRPEHVPGPLFIGGVGLARGYWRDETATRERFVVHPRTGERLFRSGDVGRFLPDGTIELLGREDAQLKLAGRRIEPGEIEAVLLRHPRVRAAVVEAPGERGGPRALVAYVVPRTVGEGAAQRPPSEGDAERAERVLSRPGLRRWDAEPPSVALPPPPADEDLRARYAARATRRSFRRGPLPLGALGELLSCLLPLEGDPSPLPRYRYPSAGSLYPVQAYVYARPGRVKGLEGGTYYHDPRTHRLILLATRPRVPKAVHDVRNREVFAASAFSLFLVGRMQAIEPVYGALARDFCLLEAGYAGQLLMSSASETGIGLCPIGGLEFGRIRRHFHLEPADELLHSFCGGPLIPDGREARRHAPLDEVLREFASSRLPAHLVPAAFVPLDALPLTRNGKVDRAALRARRFPATGANGNGRGSRGSGSPRSPLEAAAASAWAEALGVEQVGVGDALFALGADSIRAVQVAGRLSTLLGREIPVAELFRCGTVAELARRLESPGTGAEDAAARGEGRRNRRGAGRRRTGAG